MPATARHSVPTAGTRMRSTTNRATRRAESCGCCGWSLSSSAWPPSRSASAHRRLMSFPVRLSAVGRSRRGGGAATQAGRTRVDCARTRHHRFAGCTGDLDRGERTRLGTPRDLCAQRIAVTRRRRRAARWRPECCDRVRLVSRTTRHTRPSPPIRPMLRSISSRRRRTTPPGRPPQKGRAWQTRPRDRRRAPTHVRAAIGGIAGQIRSARWVLHSRGFPRLEPGIWRPVAEPALPGAIRREPQLQHTALATGALRGSIVELTCRAALADPSAMALCLDPRAHQPRTQPIHVRLARLSADEVQARSRRLRRGVRRRE